MIKFAWKIVLFMTLAACGATLPKGEVEPIRKVLSDNRGLPYECVDYDAVSDTCLGLVTRRVRGDRIYFDARMLIPGPDSNTARMLVKVDFKIEGARYCGNLGRADIQFESKLTPGQKSLVQELVLAELIQMGDVCGIYYLDGGDYQSVTTDRAGRIIPDGVEAVHFFRKPKRLRL